MAAMKFVKRAKLHNACCCFCHMLLQAQLQCVAHGLAHALWGHSYVYTVVVCTAAIKAKQAPYAPFAEALSELQPQVVNMDKW